MAKPNSKPPLRRLFTTGTLKQMAVARYQGGITWANNIFVNEARGVESGILLFDSQAAAEAYQKRQGGYPFVVCEFPVTAINKDLLSRCEEVAPHVYSGEFRQWIYPQAIVFDRCWWHTYKETLEQTVTELPPGEIILRT